MIIIFLLFYSKCYHAMRNFFFWFMFAFIAQMFRGNRLDKASRKPAQGFNICRISVLAIVPKRGAQTYIHILDECYTLKELHSTCKFTLPPSVLHKKCCQGRVLCDPRQHISTSTDLEWSKEIFETFQYQRPRIQLSTQFHHKQS